MTWLNCRLFKEVMCNMGLRGQESKTRNEGKYFLTV